MAFDPSNFNRANVVDTCAVWHILSSQSLYSKAKVAQCGFCVTFFVYYECLRKPRKTLTANDAELISRLMSAQKKSQFSKIGIEIEDLQEIAILQKRKNLGKGELTSIAFAKKANIAFITDDQKARKLASSILPQGNMQTTPHLLGWLAFRGDIIDSDKDDIKREHMALGQALGPHFEDAFREAMRCKLLLR